MPALSVIYTETLAERREREEREKREVREREERKRRDRGERERREKGSSGVSSVLKSLHIALVVCNHTRCLPAGSRKEMTTSSENASYNNGLTGMKSKTGAAQCSSNG